MVSTGSNPDRIHRTGVSTNTARQSRDMPLGYVTCWQTVPLPPTNQVARRDASSTLSNPRSCPFEKAFRGAAKGTKRRGHKAFLVGCVLAESAVSGPRVHRRRRGRARVRGGRSPERETGPPARSNPLPSTPHPGRGGGPRQTRIHRVSKAPRRASPPSCAQRVARTPASPGLSTGPVRPTRRLS